MIKHLGHNRNINDVRDFHNYQRIIDYHFHSVKQKEQIVTLMCINSRLVDISAEVLYRLILPEQKLLE